MYLCKWDYINIGAIALNSIAIFIDPSSNHFLNDQLFEISNSTLNRDGTLLPFYRLKKYYAQYNIPVHTADKLQNGSERRKINYYWSLGILEEYNKYLDDPDVYLKGFIVFEPPLVQPNLYKNLSKLTKYFDEVYLHNDHGHGYSIKGVRQDRLRKLHWPQPYDDVLLQYWARNDRLNKLVVIAGAHNPGFRKPELYSERIKAVAEISGLNGIDLYGRGWNKICSRELLWWPFIKNRSELLGSYKGECASKLETLSKYRFSLCFENMPMDGYVTEKIFDCLYAGTVPIYLGAPNIDSLLPKDSYIDMRDFSDYKAMFHYVTNISDREWQYMREKGRKFIINDSVKLYFNSLANIIKI